MNFSEKLNAYEGCRLEMEKPGSAYNALNSLFDDGSFVEIGAFVKDAQGNKESVVTGYGAVDMRLTYAFAQDGGAFGKKHADKIALIIEDAVKTGAPVVGIFNCGGAKIENGVDIIASYSKVFKAISKASGVVPLIAIINGVCSGISLYAAKMFDIVIMDENGGAYLNSSAVVDENVGDAMSFSKCGGAHIVCNDGVTKAKTILKYFPSNNMEESAFVENNDDINRLINIDDIVSENQIDMTKLTTELFDSESLTEVFENYGKGVKTYFASLGQISCVAIVSNDKADQNAVNKAARMVSLADSFNIPILSIVDSTGVLADAKDEINGMSSYGARLISCLCEATCPKIAIIASRAYGSGYSLFASKSVGFDYVIAWPVATVCALEPDKAAALLYKKELKDFSHDELCEKYIKENANIYDVASSGEIDDIIDAKTTRQLAFSSLDMLLTKSVVKINKKHGNMPF